MHEKAITLTTRLAKILRRKRTPHTRNVRRLSARQRTYPKNAQQRPSWPRPLQGAARSHYCKV